MQHLGLTATRVHAHTRELLNKSLSNTRVRTSYYDLSQNERNAARNTGQEHLHYARLMSVAKANYYALRKSTCPKMHRARVLVRYVVVRITIHLSRHGIYTKRVSVIITAPSYARPCYGYRKRDSQRGDNYQREEKLSDRKIIIRFSPRSVDIPS